MTLIWSQITEKKVNNESSSDTFVWDSQLSSCFVQALPSLVHPHWTHPVTFRWTSPSLLQRWTSALPFWVCLTDTQTVVPFAAVFVFWVFLVKVISWFNCFTDVKKKVKFLINKNILRTINDAHSPISVLIQHCLQACRRSLFSFFFWMVGWQMTHETRQTKYD